MTELRTTTLAKAFLHAIDRKNAKETPWEKEGNESQWSKIYRKKAFRFLPFLRYCPGIRGVLVCNSVAFGTAEKSSDIDLLIITAPKKLWTARVFSTVILHILGVRRHGKKIAGRFCLSFFVTENALNFSHIALPNGDPYLGFWTKTLIPIFGEEVFRNIQKQNQIFVKYETGEEISDKKIPTGDSHFRNLLEHCFKEKAEVFFRKHLFPRTLRKKENLPNTSGTILSDTMLKFHDQDRREEIRKKCHNFLQHQDVSPPSSLESLFRARER